MDDPQKILQAFKHFRNHRHELLVFHIFDPAEQELSFKHETEFVDSESGEKITVNPWQIQAEYRSQYADFYESLKAASLQLEVEYNPTSTTEDVAKLLLKYLIKRRKGL
jgi:hypothetical protein